MAAYDERIERKIEVAFFVLSKKFKGLDRARFSEEVTNSLAALLGQEGLAKAASMQDDDLIPLLNDAVEATRKNYVMTLPRKRGKPSA